MSRNLWKYLGVFLLFFTLIGGLFIPLKPNIYQVEVIDRQLNEEVLFLELRIQGYNFSFQNPADIQVWLSNTYTQNVQDLGGICASEIKLENAGILTAKFELHHPESGINYDLFLSSHSLKENIVVSHRSAFQLKTAEKDALKQDESFCSVLNREHYEGSGFYFPFREQLYETIRNLFFHVPMWFVMMILSTISMIYSIAYLHRSHHSYDSIAHQSVQVSLLFAFFGLVTGSIWARFTWGSWWVMQDVKLNGAALTVLVYLSYLFLRSSVKEQALRGRLSAVYNIFSFVLMIIFLMILPRQLDSLHPGNGGNPAFNAYDLDNHLRIFFYPAVLGWILIALWILELKIRIEKIKQHEEDKYF